MFSFRKNTQLYDKLEMYFRIAQDTMVLFSETMKHMINKGFDEHYELLAEKTCQAESHADDIRRQIEAEMYQNALLPETREDILMIIELIDQTPSQAKEIVRSFTAQRVLPAKKIKKQFIELLEIVNETFDYVIEGAKASLGKSQKKITDISLKVDTNESLGDGLEFDMISKIFGLEISTGDKLLQKEIVREVGGLCDLCEATIDRIVIFSIKRHI